MSLVKDVERIEGGAEEVFDRRSSEKQKVPYCWSH